MSLSPRRSDFDALANAAGCVLITVGASGRIDRVDVGTTSFDRTAEGERFLDLIDARDREVVEAALAALASADPESTSDTTRFEAALIATNDTRHVNWTARRLEDDSIQLLGFDNSEMEHTRQATAHEEELWRAVLRTAVDPIILIDSNGIILRANDSTMSLFGWDRDELVGKNVSVLMPEPFRSEHDGYLARYLETGEAHIIGIGREVYGQRRDGTTFPMALAVSQVESDGVRQFTGIVHDLTLRHEAEAKLVALNEQLEEKVEQRTVELEASLLEIRRSNRDLEQFAYIASHDLQAPLRNVRQGLEMLDEHLQETLGASFDDEANELRRLTIDSVTRMEDLIRGLLAYSRVQRTDRVPEENVDLAQVAETVAQQLALDLREAGVELIIDPLPIVRGDETQLRQLLQNLVQNAIKYRDLDRRAQVTISHEPSDTRWVVSVTDNGVGVDPSQHNRIFELFRRAHTGRSGVGLGLAICQRIVERHGGEIWVHSEPGDGARFSFALPRNELS